MSKKFEKGVKHSHVYKTSFLFIAVSVILACSSLWVNRPNLCQYCDKIAVLMYSAAIGLFVSSLLWMVLWRKKEKEWTKYLWVVIIFLFAIQFITLFTYDYDLDGIIHTYYTWRIYDGAMPYRDFIIMDNPLSYYVFSPLLHIIPETYHVYALRVVMFIFYFLILFFVYKTYKLLEKEKRFGLVAVLLLMSQGWFFANMFIVRPDVPMTFLILVSIYFEIKYLKSPKPAKLSWAGFFSGLAYLTKQKSLFVVPGQVLGLVQFKKWKPSSLTSLIKEGVWFFWPFLVLILAGLAWLFYNGTLWKYYLYAMQLPFLVDMGYSVWNNVFSIVFAFNILFWGLSVFACIYFLRNRKASTNLLLWALASYLFLFIMLIARNPTAHYFLPILPILA